MQQNQSKGYHIPGLITLLWSETGDLVVHGVLHQHETWGRVFPDGRKAGDMNLLDWSERCMAAFDTLAVGETTTSPEHGPYSVLRYRDGILVRGRHPHDRTRMVECRAELKPSGQVEFWGYKELLIDAARPHTIDDAVVVVEAVSKASRHAHTVCRGVLFKSDEESSAMDLLAHDVRASLRERAEHKPTPILEKLKLMGLIREPERPTPVEAARDIVDEILA